MDATDVRGLLGLLLPNGNLIEYRTPTGSYAQATITGGARDAAFIEEKVAEFRRFVYTRARVVPYEIKHPNRPSTKILRFRVSNRRLLPVYNLLYPEGFKRISQTVLDMLGARAAAWLWAGGVQLSRRHRAKLCHVGQTFEEAALVARWLFVLTGAEASIDDSRSVPRLRFVPAETEKVRSALLPYAPQTRLHLFKGDPIDRVTVRSKRTELRARRRKNVAKGEDGPSVAPNPEAGVPSDILEESAGNTDQSLPVEAGAST